MNHESGVRLPARFSFSQSALQDYADCPRRFELRYLKQLRWPAIESEPALENEKHMLEGQQFHQMAHQHLVGIPEEHLMPVANNPTLARWWKNYIALRPDLSGYTLHPEVTLSVAMHRVRVTAKFDLIAIQNDHKALIIDWKTYRMRPRDEWLAARWQTRIYRAILLQAGTSLNGGQPLSTEQIDMMYWFTNFPHEPAQFTYSKAQANRDLSLLTKTITEIMHAQEFGMTDDVKRCRFCPYRSYCDRGVQAGLWSEAEAEAELDLQADFSLNFEQVGEIEF